MENEEWRAKIDSVVLYDKIEEIKAQFKDLERIIRGGRDSLLSEYRRHDQELTRINAILFQDPTGQKGLLHDVDFLMGRRKYDNQYNEQTRGLKWQFWGMVLVAIIGSLAGILPNLSRIALAFHSLKEVHYQPDSQMKKEIEADKKRHKKRKSQVSASTTTTEPKSIPPPSAE